MKNNIMEYNKLKRLKLIQKIMECKGDYRLFCIDVDDVIFDIDPYVQNLLEDIDYRATKKYRKEIADETSEDTQASWNKSFDILNAILEETQYIDYNYKKDRVSYINYKQLDYDDIYEDKNLFPGAVDFIKLMLSNKRENDFFIFLSHRNPVREAITKTKRLYELFPEIDAIETLPYHEKKGDKNPTSKAVYIKEVYDLESLNNCILIDNSRGNCLDFREHGGMDIRFLPEGFNRNHTLSDHFSRLTELDPYKLQMAISYILYAREHPEYVDEIDERTNNKVKKLK